jgi:diguanylate cyclase (GGDEF)-like protein
VAAASTNRRIVGAAAAFVFPAVFVASLIWERPGLGLPHFFYIAIALAALAGGARIGAAAGLVAAGMYAAIVIVNPLIPSRDLLTTGTAIRAVTFVSIGTLIGWFAANNRTLMAELQVLAQRDSLTGLPNTRAFESAITRRLDRGETFAMLVGDIDALSEINERHGRLEGDDLLRSLASRLVGSVGQEDDVARIGSDEFAILVSTTAHTDAARLATNLEQAVAAGGRTLTFGWSSFPQDGENALSLYRAADERLYARKLIRGRRLEDGGRNMRAIS